jgi:prolyl-tRNA editing enzyme YbaK/EbsC (Cys-tRNA(Pro) deacylase)
MSEQAQAKQDEARLVEWARQRGLDVRLHDDLPLVKTVAQAAQALGVSPAQIAKSVVFMAEDRPVVVLAPGDAKVVDRLVVDHVGGVRNRFRLARPAEVLEATGYPVGGVPPFGYPRPVRTLIESRLLENDRVIFGGGSDRALLEVAPDDVKRVTKAEPGTFTA